MRYCISAFVLLFVLFVSSCSLFEEECDSAPDADQADSFFVNQTGFGECNVVAPGFMNILDWGYFYGSDAQKNGGNSGYTKFRWTFEPSTGFFNEDGTPIDGSLVTADNTPHVYASLAASDKTIITVQAFNDCGESEIATDSIMLQRTNVVEVMRPQLPHPVSAPVVGFHNNTVYMLFGRYEGTYSGNGVGRDVFMYDLTTRSWSTKPLPTTPRTITNRYSCVQVGTKIYMFERVDNFAFVYDIVNNTLTELAPNPNHNISGDYDGRQLLYDNEKIYVGPARSGAAGHYSIFTYDIASNSWDRIHDMPSSIVEPQGDDMQEMGEAAFMLNGKMYFLLDGNQAYEYDPVTNTGTKFFTSFSQLSVVATAFVNNNVAYVINSGNGTTINGQLYKFNPVNRSFTVKSIFQNTACLAQNQWIGGSILTRSMIADGYPYIIGGERQCGSNAPCVGNYFYKLHLSE